MLTVLTVSNFLLVLLNAPNHLIELRVLDPNRHVDFSYLFPVENWLDSKIGGISYDCKRRKNLYTTVAANILGSIQLLVLIMKMQHMSYLKTISTCAHLLELH